MPKLVALLAVAAAWALPQGQAGTQPRPAAYAVVVNAKNPATETGDAARALVRKLYLKDLTQWPKGTDAKPYAREGTAPEQAAFLKDVLGMSDAELARHWLKLRNMSGTTPPADVDSDRLLLKHIARHEGAFGVVKVQAAKAAGVKVLFEF